MRTQTWVALTVGITTSLLLAACGSTDSVGTASQAQPTSVVTVAAVPADQTRPSDLVGSWRLLETDEPAGTVVTMSAGLPPGSDSVARTPGGDLYVWRACGELSGGWTASADGLFVSAIDGLGGKCPTRELTTGGPKWLRTAFGFRTDGADRLLLDQAGRVTARLAPGGRATPGPDILASEADPDPPSDAFIRASVAPPALPASVRPALAAELVGTWVGASAPTPLPKRISIVAIRADGTWGGTDGCNGIGGRWASGRGGGLLASSGSSTLIYCDPGKDGDVPTAFDSAARAGFVGTELVLFGDRGERLVRLKRVYSRSR